MQHKVFDLKKKRESKPFDLLRSRPRLCIVSVVAAVIQRDVMTGNLVLIRSWHEMLTPAKKGRAGNGRTERTRRSLHFDSES